MLVYAFLLILLIRSSWGLWGLFSIVAAVLTAIAGVAAQHDAITVAFGTAINGIVFCALGAAIVWLCLKFKKGGSRQDKEVDEELARIRAQSAARDNHQPLPTQ